MPGIQPRDRIGHVRTGVLLGMLVAVMFPGLSLRGDVLAAVRSRAATADDSAILDRSEPIERHYGRKGSREWHASLFGAAEFGVTDFLGGRVGVDWFVEERFSLGIQLDLTQAWVGGGSRTISVGVAPILRWHFLRGDAWTLYAEAGSGIVWNGAPIPTGGTRFDFTPQAALGGTLDLGGGTRLRAAVGWFHMSNARTSSSNPGLDALSVTVGLGWEF